MKAMKYISAALLTVLVVVVAGCSADRELPKLTGNTAADTPKNSQTLVLTVGTPTDESTQTRVAYNDASIAAIHVEPMGLYGGKQTTLDALTTK